MKAQTVARWGEAEVDRYLRRLGWEIVAHNWSCRFGELDLIAREGDEWVFVEVKTRRGKSFGTPEEGVTPAKRSRLLRSAATYLEARGAAAEPWRIDVVAVEGRPGRPPSRLDHYRDAVEDDQDAFR